MLTALLEQIVNGLMVGCIYVLVALGMVLIFGIMEVLNFAHGALFMVGGYICHFAFYKMTGSYPASIVLSMLALALIGIVLEAAVFRQLRDNVQMQIVASLGLILVIQNGVVELWGPQALQMSVPTTQLIVRLGPLSFTAQHFIIIATVAVTVILMQLFLARSRYGIAMRAISQNADAALIVGINSNRMFLFTFASASALAALGGALIGPMFLIFPQMGDLPLLKALTAIVLGGMGSVPGAVIGGLAIGVVESLSTLIIPTDFRDTVVFGLLILVLLVRPWGLFGFRVRGEVR
jgi:branched-chain amino acid transport system permease protein